MEHHSSWEDLFMDNSISQISQYLRCSMSLDYETNIELEEIVRALKGELKQVEGFEKKAQLKKISGNNSFEITLNPDATEEEKRFSIAHELGHLFFTFGYLTESWDDIPDSATVYNDHTTTFEEEYRADSFAFEFLMPDVLFTSIAEVSIVDGAYDFNSIATQFGVSREMVIKRGLQLKVWKIA